MICTHCNQPLPEGCKFCPHCSCPVTPPAQNPTVALPRQTFCQVCGSAIDPVTRTCPRCYPRSSISLTSLLAILLAVALVISAVFNVVQIRRKNRLEEEITALESTVATTKAELETASAYKKKAQYYDDILAALRTGSIGRASNSFSTSDSVILVNKATKDRKFTLKTTWRQGATISVDYLGSSATVSFDKSSWYDSTTLTVVPKSEGITAVTFSNDLNADTFSVLIIVVS